MADDFLKLDLKDFERKARDLGAAIDQVPYALKNVMNDAAFGARLHLADDIWPGHVMVRSKNFMRAALRVDKATKGKLEVAVYDSLGRANLKKHATGGTKTARGQFAVPSKNVRVGPRGVVPSQRAKTLARSFRRGNLIFQRVGRKGVRLMFSLVRSVRIKPDVPFYSAFSDYMRKEINAKFPDAIMKAMRTRR
jgi:hypothetical protein